MTEDAFKVGDEVVVRSGWGGYGVMLSKVAKVHKNGNFILEGSKQQYRRDGFSTASGALAPIAYHATPERVAEYYHTKAVQVMMNLRDKTKFTDWTIDELKEAIALFKRVRERLR